MISYKNGKKGWTGSMIHFGLEILCYGQNGHNTMRNEGEDPAQSWSWLFKQHKLKTHQKLENLRGMLVPIQDPAWNTGSSFGMKVAFGRDAATRPIIAAKFAARSKSKDESKALFLP